ncbi:hypothetical protein GALL_545420 [mine drainage metagenome]|uniref:Uncharacterized protein n=1 Tax=mine drainage metagenome TaxID=410659 RepID=A0A1J5P7Y5_9ZZZZ
MALGDPGGAVAHDLSRLDDAGLDHGQREADDGIGVGVGGTAVKADAGARQVKVILMPQQDAAGRGERARDAGAIGQRVERRKLLRVHRIAGLIRAGKMAHQQFGSGGEDVFSDGGPLIRLHPEAIHPGIQLDAERVAGQRFEVARDLIDRVQHRRQVKVVDHIGVAGLVPREDADLRAGAKRLTHDGALFGNRDEEATRTGLGQRFGNAVGAKAIGIGFYHGSGLGAGVTHTIQRPPVSGDGVEVNGKGRCAHGPVLTGPGGRSRGNARLRLLRRMQRRGWWQNCAGFACRGWGLANARACV